MVDFDVEKELGRLLSPAEPGLQFSQGVVLEWNPETFENKVEWKKITLTNVPVLSGPDALTYQAGDVLALLGWNPGGGLGSWWIIGRVITPGAGAGAKAIDWMTSSLGAALAKSVLAAGIQIDTNVRQSSTTTENVWLDLDFAGSPDPGPSVEVEIGPSGKCLVICSARIQVAEFGTALMSFEGTGPENFSAGFYGSVFHSVDLAASEWSRPTCTSSMLIQGVAPGVYTLMTKYQVSNLTGIGINFTQRVIVAIPF